MLTSRNEYVQNKNVRLEKQCMFVLNRMQVEKISVVLVCFATIKKEI